MISSEVQRTLVKSPPELWAELSDQATLARHLGELGEIRITRVEPQRAVEWEAENISGTVRLKPSGWGTRVTLTVTREIPDPTIRAAPDSLVAAEPVVQDEPAVDETSARVDFESTMQAAFEPAADVETEADRETERKPPMDVQAQTVRDAEPEPPMDVQAQTVRDAEPEPPMDVGAEAVPEAEAEPPMDVGAEAVPEAEAEPSTHVEVEPELQVGPEAAFALEIEHYEAIAEEPVQAFDPELRQTRRSFFSRLFRRRPRTEPVEPDPYELTAVAEEPWVSEWDEPLTLLEPSFEPGESGEDPYATIEPTPGALDPGEPLATEEAIATEEPAAVDTPERADAEGLIAASTEEPVAGAAAGPADLSAELKAAEQVAAEQVTIVLTAVLDRLGAAHHRPFSRA